MASFDANLGSVSADKSAATGTITQALTTAAAAASGTRVVVFIGVWAGTIIDANTPRVATVSDGSAYTLDLRVLNPNGADSFEIWSRPAAGGLASGSTITATWSPATTANHVVGGELMGAASIAGVDMTNGGGVTSTGSSNAQSGTGWVSGTAGAGGGIALGGVSTETALSSASTISTGVEIHDDWLATAQQGFTTGYNLGGTSLSGTLSNTSTATTGGIVVYTDATFIGALTNVRSPRMRARR